jgi:hypothetical protein
MSDRLNTTTKKNQNLDSTFKVNPFQSRGFGVQPKSDESVPATKAQLWESYQQAKQLNQSGAIQTKLTIGQPGDKYEQEADSVADRVMAMPEPKLAKSSVTNSVQTRSVEPIQRACTECQEETKEESKSEEDGDRILAKAELGQTPELTSIQRKLNSDEDACSGSNLEDRLNGSKGGGHPLSNDVRSFMEPRFGADFSSVRVHTGTDALQMNQDVNAQAFAHGQDVYFGAGKAPGKDALTAHELTHVIQQSIMPTDRARSIQRKELSLSDLFTNPSEIQSDRNWTESDRKNNTQRWQDACLANLKAADSSQYVKVVERRDFYKWFYEYTAALGYTTRWALAAYVVANGAHQIADMDEEHAWANDGLNMANVELQGAMREGNQVIFDNVLPKLKKLFDGGPLKGKPALEWDMKVLAEEQTLIQPMYSRMSPDTIDQLNYIATKKRFAGWGAWWTDEDKVPKGKDNNAGTVPGFNQPNIQNINDRWTYGMNLGNQFTPGGTGFDANKDKMPTVGMGYQDGSELAKIDTRANLHKLDAWLNPNRMSRVRGNSGSDIQAIINSLTTFEKQQVLLDRSPDGWSYSIQFAQFISITDATVQQSLPSDPSSAPAIAAFLNRYKMERNKVKSSFLTLPLMY